MNLKGELVKGLARDNPVFVLVLGMCPALAVTTRALNGVALGLATTAVLLCSNIIISSLRKFIPQPVRIPIFIVIIASFVTIVGMLMAAFFYQLNRVLGIFIPLIVVNCIILGRAEAFASRNSVPSSIADGLGMGLGFTVSLTILGAIREVLGNGTLFGRMVCGANFEPLLLMLLPPGAFIALGLLLGLMRRRR